jgi:hypothetical protein
MKSQRAKKALLTAITMGLLSFVLSPIHASEAADKKGKTLGEWLAIYKPMFEKRNAEWRNIISAPDKFNAFYESEDEIQSLMHRQLLYVLHGEKLSSGRIKGPHPKRQKYITEYRTWLNEKGWDLMLRWRSGKLKENERKYLPIIKVGYLHRGILEFPHRQSGKLLFKYDKVFSAKFAAEMKNKKLNADETACVRYAMQIASACDAAKTKAMQGKLLDEADIESMRAVFRMDRMKNMAPGNPFPHSTHSLLKPGTRNADLYLPKLEAVLSSPRYTDLYPRHPYDLYFEESAYWVLRGLEAFELVDKEVVKVKPGAWDMFKNNTDFFNISDYRGEKIVVLNYVSLFNDDDNLGRHMLQTYLDRMYGDKVKFIFMYSHLGTGEQWFQYPNYFGPKMDYSRIGTVGMEYPGSCPITKEELARDVKLSLMSHPSLTHTHTFAMPNGLPTVPLVDDIANRVNGGLVIIDIDGTVVCNEEKQRSYIHFNTGYRREPFHLNVLEKELRLMIANGGKVVEGARKRLRMINVRSWKAPAGPKALLQNSGLWGF